MKLHAWHSPDSPLRGINPMLWVDCQQDASDQAPSVARLLSNRPRGDRVLFLWKPFDLAPWMHDPARLIAMGLPYQADWYETFFRRLHDLGCPRIDLIVVDHEQGQSVWHWHRGAGTMERWEAMEKIYADPTAARQLPTKLRKLGPRLAQEPLDHDAIIAWNEWAWADAAKRLKIVSDTQSRAMGYRARFSNYNCGRIGKSLGADDHNGWPMSPAPVSSYSSWSLYPTGEGVLFAGMNPDEAKRADLVRCLKIVDATPGTSIPWVSYPSYVGVDTWRLLVAGLHARGVRELLYWNPRTNYPGGPLIRPLADLEADDAAAAEIILSLENR